MDYENTHLEFIQAYYLPVLYKIDSKGRERMWKVHVKGDTVYKIYGMVGGAPVASEKKFSWEECETTPENKALKEAERAWNEKLTKMYRPKCKEGMAMMKKRLLKRRKFST